MHDVAELIHALAALAWPIVVLALLVIYKPDVVRLLERVKRAKVPALNLSLMSFSQPQRRWQRRHRKVVFNFLRRAHPSRW